MTRKFFAAILAGMMVLCLMLTSFSSPAMAAGEITFISNRTELANISGSGSYRLTADIDLSGPDWTPLPAFSGTLDGGGYVISNLSITDTTSGNKGLFASVASGAQIYNLGIEDVNITAGDHAGGIAGTNNGAISRCYTTGSISGAGYVGGLAGENGGTIENCYSRARVSGTSHIGGLAGSNSGAISKSYAASTVTDSVMRNYLLFTAADPIGGAPSQLFRQGGYVRIPHDGDIYKDISAFTLEAWFQWGSAGTGNTEFIIGKGIEQFEIHTGGGAGRNGLRFIPIPADNSETLGGFAGDSYIDVENVLQTGWFHVAAVYSYDSSKEQDNVTVQVYVNGVAQNLYHDTQTETVGPIATLTRTSNPLSNIAYPITIGKRGGDETLYFNGKIADVRFWNVARTGEEIRANKDKELVGNETGLLGYWKLKEASGNAIDTAHGMDGVLTNTGAGSVTHVTSADILVNKGALEGSHSGAGSVVDCFYDSALFGSDSGGAGTAQPTGEMKTQGTYSGWDFGTIWKMEGGDYPRLRFKKVTSVTVNPISVSIQKGGSQSFSAAVTGAENPAGTVNWSVEGKTSTTTAIDTNGVLFVGSDETAATLTVKAISTFDPSKDGTATVTVTEAEPTEYKIIRGQNGKWAKGSTDGLVFTANGYMDEFTGVSVDGRALLGDQYTARNGSTIVTLKAEYLNTLSAGRHTLRINYSDGYAETYFTMLAEADVPATGDGAQPMLWLGLALMAGALLISTALLRRRRQNG